MRIQRYLNGEPVSREVLSTLSLVTPALANVVRDVDGRTGGGEVPSADQDRGAVTDANGENAAEG